VSLESAAAAQRIRELWAAAEVEHVARRALADFLVDRLSGRRSAAYEVNAREVPGRSLLCLKRNVAGELGLAAQCPELSLRSEPAHHEAFVNLGAGGQISPAQWRLASDSLHAWAKEHDARPTGLGARITYLLDGGATETRVPDCDLAITVV